MLLKGLRAVAKETLSAGADILSNVEQNNTKQLKNQIVTRGTEAVKNLKRKADDTMQKVLSGSGASTKRQKRTLVAQMPTLLNLRKKRKSTNKRKISSKKQKRKKPTQKKKRNKKSVSASDIFA